MVIMFLYVYWAGETGKEREYGRDEIEKCVIDRGYAIAQGLHALLIERTTTTQDDREP